MLSNDNCIALRKRFKSVLSTVFLLTGMAMAADYTVDPLTGSMDNPGTAESPWKTWAEVMATKTFQPGDRIFLRRGYHGMVSISGHNTEDVFVLPAPGHTPTVRSLRMMNASHWNISGLTFSDKIIPVGHPDRQRALPVSKHFIIIDDQTNEGSHYNTISDCYGYTVQVEETAGWKYNDWLSCRGTAQNYGKYNTIRNCHWYNTKGGMLNGFHSDYFTYKNNIHENFVWDAMQQKADYGLFENNLVMNYYIVDSNHNDGFQSYGGNPRTGTVVRNNIFIAYTNPNQPYRWGSKSAKSKYCHGIGMFDGWYDDWVIEGNHVMIDYQTGIWIRGARRLKLINNNVTGVSASGKPKMVVGDRKSGGSSRDITSINNLLVWQGHTSKFVDWPRKDIRRSGSRDGSAPSKPTNVRAVIIPGYGVDLHWNASSDNRPAHMGYDIYRNGVRVGHKRTGPNFFHPSTDTSGQFTVRAFDFVGNTSAPSEVAVVVPGGPGQDPEPEPTPDTQKPTAPTGVTAVAQSHSAILVGWTASSDNVGVAAYHVYSGASKVGTSTTTSFNHTGLSGNTTYLYTVKSLDAAGNESDDSEQASATTQVNPSNPPVEPPPSGATIYEAEKATVVGAKKFVTYVDYVNNSGDYIEWTVQAPAAGTYTLGFRYALGSGNRPLGIKVNGVVVAASLAFPGTGSSTDYEVVTLQAALKAGSNKVRATAIGLSGGNMDNLSVSSP